MQKKWNGRVFGPRRREAHAHGFTASEDSGEFPAFRSHTKEEHER